MTFGASIRVQHFALVVLRKQKTVTCHPRRTGPHALSVYVAANHVPADFVSFHVYGNATTGAVIENLINVIRTDLTSTHSTATVAITEWGPSYESTPG